MPIPTLRLNPSLESTASVGETIQFRPSLYDNKDAFTERVAPIGMAAMYFGSFSLAPQDAALSRQALFKLTFVNRHFLQSAGLRILVRRQTAVLSGQVANSVLVTLSEILARQIEGINQVVNEIEAPIPAKSAKQRDAEMVRESVALLFATDQTLRTGVQIQIQEGRLKLEGQVASAAQKNWAEQLVQAAGGELDSKLKIGASAVATATNPADVDDESLQALVLVRLRLVRETEHLPLRVKAHRGVLTLQGKVRTEALRQRTENLARSTLGLRELRSTLTIAA